MARVTKVFDPEKKLPFWYLDFDGDRYGPFSTRQEALDFGDGETSDEECAAKRIGLAPLAGEPLPHQSKR